MTAKFMETHFDVERVFEYVIADRTMENVLDLFEAL
jgi:hypothetical protein